MGKYVYITDKQIDVIWKLICFIEDRIVDSDDNIGPDGELIDDGMAEDYKELMKLYEKYSRKK